MEKTYFFSIQKSTGIFGPHGVKLDVRNMDIGVFLDLLQEEQITVDKMRSEKYIRDDDNGIVVANLAEDYKGKTPFKLVLRAPALGLEMSLSDYHRSLAPENPLEQRFGVHYGSEERIDCTVKYDPVQEESRKRSEAAIKKAYETMQQQRWDSSEEGKAMDRIRNDPKNLELAGKVREAAARLHDKSQ